MFLYFEIIYNKLIKAFIIQISVSVYWSLKEILDDKNNLIPFFFSKKL